MTTHDDPAGATGPSGRPVAGADLTWALLER
jgi:hypothetical protein